MLIPRTLVMKLAHGYMIAIYKLITADHTGDQASHPCNGFGKLDLNCSETVVERRSAVLGIYYQWSHDE